MHTCRVRDWLIRCITTPQISAASSRPVSALYSYAGVSLHSASPLYSSWVPDTLAQANAGYPDGMKSVRTFNKSCTDLNLRKVIAGRKGERWLHVIPTT